MEYEPGRNLSGAGGEEVGKETGTGGCSENWEWVYGGFKAIDSHEGRWWTMRSVNVAKLKDRLSEYLGFAKNGEEIIIWDRNLPMAKLVPFKAETASEQELLLVAAAKMRLGQKKLDHKKFWRMPAGKVNGNKAIKALLADREESL